MLFQEQRQTSEDTRLSVGSLVSKKKVLLILAGKKKNLLMLEPIIALAATLGPLLQEYCTMCTPVTTCFGASSQPLSSLPASPGLESFTSTPFPGVMSDAGYQEKWGPLRAGGWLLGVAGR